MKKACIFGLLMILGVCLCACSNKASSQGDGKNNNDNAIGIKTATQIQSDLPESVTSLSIGNKCIEMDITGFEIEKRKTKEDMDYVYCRIDLKSEAISVTTYQLLTYSQYNGNVWMLESVEEYQKESIEVYPTNDRYQSVIKYIEAMDSMYADFTQHIDNQTVEAAGQTISYKFDFSKTIGIMNVYGTMHVKCYLNGSFSQGFNWVYTPDDSEVNTDWNLKGTWSGYLNSNIYGTREFTFTIDKLTSKTVEGRWHYKYDWDDYYGDGSDCWIIGQDGEKVEIGVQYDSAVLAYMTVTIFASGKVQVTYHTAGVVTMYEVTTPVTGPPTIDDKSTLYSVTVVDQYGDPVSGAWVQLFANGTYTPSTTDSLGVATFELDPNEYIVSFMVIPTGYTYSSSETSWKFGFGEKTMRIILNAT